MKQSDFYLSDAIEVIEEVLATGGEFRMYPRGTSMLPLIVQGRDSVVLKRNKEIPARKNDIAFYRRTNGQFVLHRVMKIEKDGTYTMCGDHQLTLERGIEAEQIIAYVSALYKDQRKVNLHSFRHSLYLLFWNRLLLRRLVLGVVRRLSKIKKTKQ